MRSCTSRLRVLASMSAGATFALGALYASPAHASNITEFPDNGSEQMGRGGAWVARASDPLATTFNPAGLAGQYTKLTIQNGFIFEKTCFARVKALNDTSNDPLVRPDGTFPEVCNDGAATINPQIGATFRLTPKLGLGLLLIGPSSGGEKVFPEFVDGPSGRTAAPQRYLLLKQAGIVVFPTIGIGYEVADNLRIGASFAWGIARLQLSNASMSLNTDAATPDNDTKAILQAQDYFIPGVNLGVLYSPMPELDVAAWFKASDAIRAYGDVGTATSYFNKANATKGDDKAVRYGDTIFEDCGTGLPQHQPQPGKPGPCDGGDNARVKINIPMEAKIGVRYHKPRVKADPAPAPAPAVTLTSAKLDDAPSTPPEQLPKGPPQAADAPSPAPAVQVDAAAAQHVRDPMSTDVFDVELDLTWAHNSVIDPIVLRFPGDPNGKGLLPVSGIQGADIPPNSDLKRGFKDVVGIRLGGDFNVIPDRLAIRAGGFFETSGLDPQYQAIDFIASSRFGMALGATYRHRFGHGDNTSALEIMAGFGHVFFGDQTRTDRSADGYRAIAGSSCNGSSPSGPTTCSDGNERYRSKWPVNLGTITESINVINVGLAYRF